MREFVDEVAVLTRWLGRDVAAELSGAVPLWSVFRFRDAAVFAPDASECADLMSADLMYLVRGGTVREFTRSQVTIDEAYAALGAAPAHPAVLPLAV